MSENSNSFSNNGVNETGTSQDGGRCPVGEQRRPGRHPTTARVTWTEQINRVVMECYYESRPIDDNGVTLRGYRQRMHKAWRERGMFDLSEQRLCDQAKAIRKNIWFTMVELEEIRRSVINKDNEGGVGNKSEINVGNESEINVEAAEGGASEAMVGVRVDNNRWEEDNSMINEIVDIMQHGLTEDTRGLKKVDRRVVREWTRKINEVIKAIQRNHYRHK